MMHIYNFWMLVCVFEAFRGEVVLDVQTDSVIGGDVVEEELCSV